MILILTRNDLRERIIKESVDAINVRLSDFNVDADRSKVDTIIFTDGTRIRVLKGNHTHSCILIEGIIPMLKKESDIQK